MYTITVMGGISISLTGMSFARGFAMVRMIRVTSMKLVI